MKVMKMVRYLAFDGKFGDNYERYGFTMPPSAMEVPQPEWNGNDILVMSGCVVKGIAPYLTNATVSALRSMGFSCNQVCKEKCCLRPPMFAYIPDDEKVKAREKMVCPFHSDELLCLCTGCAAEMSVIKERNTGTIDFLYENMDRLPRTKEPLRLAIQTGCEVSGKRGQLTEIVERMGYVDVGNPMGCCGKDTKIAKDLMADREKECQDADAILAVCPKCFTEYDSYEGGRPVIFIMELVAMAFGDRSTLGFHRIKL